MAGRVHEWMLEHPLPPREPVTSVLPTMDDDYESDEDDEDDED